MTVYDVFMNPRSTDRELKKASEAYWIWGEEGFRFNYAVDIYNQLNR